MLDDVTRRQWRRLNEMRFDLSAEHEMKVRGLARSAVQSDATYGYGTIFPILRGGARFVEDAVPQARCVPYDEIRVALIPEFRDHHDEALLEAERQIRDQWRAR